MVHKFIAYTYMFRVQAKCMPLQNFSLFNSESFIIPSSHMSVQHPVACVIEVCIGTVNATLLIYYPLLDDVILLGNVSVQFRTIFKQYT
jgi:hypothetical protein